MQSALPGAEGHLHAGRALRRHVGPGPVVFVRGVQHGQADAVTHALARIPEQHGQRRARAGELRRRGHQRQRQPAQGGVAHVHAHDRAAREQEGEQVAQIELVVDRAHQQHHEREAQHEAGTRRQDVHVALRERHRVGERQPCLPPLAKAAADVGEGVQRWALRVQRGTLCTLDAKR